jgi:hypothetical protein
MRPVLAYLLLVGGPLLVLLGILRTGGSLVAPPSIGGTWLIYGPTAGEVGRCLGTGASLEISQSGVRSEAVLRPAGAGLHIQLRGDRIVGAGGPTAGCGDSRIALAGQLEGGAAIPGTMTGTLTLADCAACTPLAFRATRATSATRRGDP